MRASILPAVALILWATSAFGQPPKAAAKAEAPKTVSIDKPLDNLPLHVAVDYVADKLQITIAIDSKGVAEGEKSFASRRIKVAQMKAPPTGFLIECLAQAAGATSRKDGKRYVIEAGQPKDLASLLSAPSPKALANAAKLVTFERPIGLLPLRELLEFVREMYNVEIYLDEVGFQRVKKLQSVGDSPVVQLPPASTVEKLLALVVSPLGGKVVVREEMILIVPDGKPAK